MKNYTFVSNAVIKRLPRYRRTLKVLLKKDVSVISSSELAKLVNSTSSQVRQDLNNFGTFGSQGYGYNVERLYNKINAILGLEKKYKMVVVGAGNLGQAIANYTHFYKLGYDIVALFDVNPKLIGLGINDIEVIDFTKIDAFFRQNQIDIGIITTNKENAQSVADKLVAGGVKGIWNFTGADLDTPNEIAIENAHLNDSLYILTFKLNQNDKREHPAFRVTSQ